jgi:hypothetical protein
MAKKKKGKKSAVKSPAASQPQTQSQKKAK